MKGKKERNKKLKPKFSQTIHLAAINKKIEGNTKKENKYLSISSS